MLRTLMAAAMVLGLSPILSAGDKADTPGAEPLTVLNPRWVQPSGKVAGTAMRAVPETRTVLRTTAKIVGGMEVVVKEEVPYTIMRSMSCLIQAETTQVINLEGKPLTEAALATQLAKAGPVLVARERLDPAYRPILKDDALVLLSPGGVSVQGVPAGMRWLPTVTLASIVERDGEVRLRLVETQASSADDGGTEPAEREQGKTSAAKSDGRNSTRELTFDGMEVQAFDLKGGRLSSRALLKRLKDWTPVLVLREKPDSTYAQTFKDDTVAVLLSGGQAIEPVNLSP
jgi:hypothetical protein